MADSKGGALESQIVPRMRVCDVEDRNIGSVLAVSPDGFCIEMQPEPWWVSYDSVFRVDGASVVLVCMREGLYKYQLQGPSPS